MQLLKVLINKRIIVRISDIGQNNLFAGMLFPMQINEKIKAKITEKTLDLPIGKSDDEIRGFVNQNRPKWAIEIDRMKNLF